MVHYVNIQGVPMIDMDLHSIQQRAKEELEQEEFARLVAAEKKRILTKRKHKFPWRLVFINLNKE